MGWAGGTTEARRGASVDEGGAETIMRAGCGQQPAVGDWQRNNALEHIWSAGSSLSELHPTPSCRCRRQLQRTWMAVLRSMGSPGAAAAGASCTDLGLSPLQRQQAAAAGAEGRGNTFRQRQRRQQRPSAARGARPRRHQHYRAPPPMLRTAAAAASTNVAAANWQDATHPSDMMVLDR